MHFICEIVIPPTDNIEESVKQVLSQYCEHGDGEETNSNAFWDWYVIGGRFAGQKILSGFDKEKLKSFYDEMKEKKVTVSGFQAGKQSLEPKEQIPLVDEMWKKHFPDFDGEHCPLFDHSNDQYSESMNGDVMKFSDVPNQHVCGRIIFAKPSYGDDEKLMAGYMLVDRIWNGANYQDTDFLDSTFGKAKEMFFQSIKNYKPEYAKKITPTDDWLVVTVDCHS